MTAMHSGLPVALTIAGSDSGGGAGIQADLKTFAALGAFGTSAITAITAQNPDGVTAIQAIDPPVVGAQIAAVLDYFPVGAAKTGMLFSAEVIGAVADALAAAAARHGPLPLVVDPVMVATSGAKLLADDAIGALQERILPLANLVTPNMAEAALLAGRPVETEADLGEAARAIGERYGVAVLVKGGHLPDAAEAVDALWHEGRLETFRSPFLRHVSAHGTGCTLSAALAVYLLRGFGLPAAVRQAKDYLHAALAAALPAGRGLVLNHGHAPQPLNLM